jgi:putative membrane protein
MAAIDNEFEIQSGQAAQQKSQNDQVKQIAQKMVEDHTKAKQQLQPVAQALQVQLPEQLPRMKQAELQIMSALPADQFDKNYLAHLQAAHAKDVTKFNAVSQISQNDQVKQFAQQLLPVLQQHAQHVNQTATAMGLPNGMEAMQAGATIQGSGSGSSGAGQSDSDHAAGASGSSSGGSSGSSAGGSSSSGGTSGSSSGGSSGSGQSK